jgi:hypothetical protein
MLSDIHQSIATMCEATVPHPERKPRIDHAQWITELKGYPADFVPLEFETRTHVTTAVMCCHLNRKEQTARAWASAESFPPGLRPLRVHGRLAWPVAGIKAVLGVSI